MIEWFAADNPPDGEKGLWSRRVIVVTNAGNAFACSYYHGYEFGCWQHPRVLEHGEKIVQWAEFPRDLE